MQKFIVNFPNVKGCDLIYFSRVFCWCVFNTKLSEIQNMCSIILILSDDFFVATPSNNQDRVNYSAVKMWRGLKQYLAVVARDYKGLIVAQKK